jgi:hypothetical protein
MPFSFDIAAFGWHATIFVSWELLGVLTILLIVGVVGTKLLVANSK